MSTNPPDLTPKPEGGKKKVTPRPKTFLFINKDPDSEVLSRSSGRVAASINSHVQRWQDKKEARSAKSQRKPQTTTNQPTGKTLAYSECVTKFRPKPRKRSAREIPQQSPPLERKHSDSSSSGPRTAYSTTPDAPDESPTSSSSVELARLVYPRPHMSTIFTANFSGADCIDPFQSTLAHLPAVQSILQYYTSFTLVSTFQNDAVSKGIRKEPPHFPAIREIIRGSLCQQMHLYALLAATAARMKRVSNISLPREGSPEYLLDNAVRCLREYLSSCSGPLPSNDRQVILDIFYLCVCEWYEKRYDTARTHLGFLRYFWSSFKPSNSIFDRYVHDMIAYNDVFLAIETARSPVFELTWEPPPLTAERIQEIEEDTRRLTISPSLSPSSSTLSSRSPLSAVTSSSARSSLQPPIAAGFATLAAVETGQHPIELTNILRDVIPLIQAAHHHSHTITPQPAREAQWVSLKTQALLHRLLCLKTPQPTLSESIRFSLLILLSCMSTSAAWRSGKVDMPQLARRLLSTLSPVPWLDPRYPIVIHNIHHPEMMLPALSPSLRGTDDSLVLWILVSGAFAAQTHAQEEQWFLVQAAQTARRMGICNSVTLKNELLRYLYLEHLQNSTLEKLLHALGISETTVLD